MKKIKILVFNIVRRIFRQPINLNNNLNIKIIGNHEAKKYSEKIKWYFPGLNFTLHSNKYNKSDIILVADVNAISFFRLITNAYKTFIVDPDFYSNIEVSNWASAYYNILHRKEKNKYSKISQRNFVKFLSKYNSNTNSYLFGSGPSIEKYDQHIYHENSIKII